MPSVSPERRSWPGLVLALAVLLLAGGPGSSRAAGAADYPQTVAAMQERYADEVRAHQAYGAYARQALDEGYPNIAHLFRALATSEAIHARNFARVLHQLGVTPQTPAFKPQVGTTQENLEQASGVEADEIDKEYPAIIERLQPEGYQDAIQNTIWAWQAEKQHRDLIIKIRDAASTWFGLLVSRIEGEPSHYYVCQICGSTLTEQPANECPICRHPASLYEEVPWLPGKPRAKDSSPFGFD